MSVSEATNSPNAPTDRDPALAPPDTAGTPQTRGQNPDRVREGAHQAEAATTTPDDATQRGGYAGSAQGPYDNRDGSPRPEGGGQSDPAPTNATSHPGERDGYTSEAARHGSAEQGVGSRGGSYNDQNANVSHSAGPRRQPAEGQSASHAAEGPDSGGASTGRTTSGDASEQV